MSSTIAPNTSTDPNNHTPETCELVHATQRLKTFSLKAKPDVCISLSFDNLMNPFILRDRVPPEITEKIMNLIDFVLFNYPSGLEDAFIFTADWLEELREGVLWYSCKFRRDSTHGIEETQEETEDRRQFIDRLRLFRDWVARWKSYQVVEIGFPVTKDHILHQEATETTTTPVKPKRTTTTTPKRLPRKPSSSRRIRKRKKLIIADVPPSTIPTDGMVYLAEEVKPFPFRLQEAIDSSCSSAVATSSPGGKRRRIIFHDGDCLPPPPLFPSSPLVAAATTTTTAVPVEGEGEGSCGSLLLDSILSQETVLLSQDDDSPKISPASKHITTFQQEGEQQEEFDSFFSL